MKPDQKINNYIISVPFDDGSCLHCDTKEQVQDQVQDQAQDQAQDLCSSCPDVKVLRS